MEPVTEQLEAVFLKHRSLPAENIFHPATLFNSGESIWIQFEDDIDVKGRISAEIESFYGNGGCDEAIKAQLKVGMCAAVHDSEKFWCRGKILQIEGSKLCVHYFDYGNTDWVEHTRVYPLHSYFAKDPQMALELGLK